MPYSSEIRVQLQNTLGNWSRKEIRPPVSGWLRAIRMALGMSGKQMARRMGVKPPRITEMEKAELDGSITLKTLRRAAQALDCEIIYAIVPKTDLDSLVRAQAQRMAARNLKSVSHTMGLEGQGLSERESAAQIRKSVEEWTKNPPRWLWDPE